MIAEIRTAGLDTDGIARGAFYGFSQGDSRALVDGFARIGILYEKVTGASTRGMTIRSVRAVLYRAEACHIACITGKCRAMSSNGSLAQTFGRTQQDFADQIGITAAPAMGLPHSLPKKKAVCQTWQPPKAVATRGLCVATSHNNTANPAKSLPGKRRQLSRFSATTKVAPPSGAASIAV